MPQTRILKEARAAFENGAWSDAHALLVAADAAAPLDAEDLERLAVTSYLTGDEARSLDARTRAHAAFLERGDPRRAAMNALWIAAGLFDTQRSQAAGWLARAQRLIGDDGSPSVERAWLLCMLGRQRAADRDVAGAHAVFNEAADLAARFADRDVLALARHGQGRTLVAMNETRAGLALLDEVMVSVTAGEVGPALAGVLYCSVISVCHELFDLRRAQEWTDALQRWCEAHPDIVPFRGYCLVRRAELMQLHGAWPDALSEARRACERLLQLPRQPETGAAYYQLGELHRLRGDFAEADEAYRRASQAGRKPQPGLALLRLAEGQLDAADAAIRLALQEARDPRMRVFLLGAAIEILLARHDVAGARAACDELAAVCAARDCVFLRGVAAQARGAVALAEGDGLAALESLRAATAAWQELDAPFELAQVRLLIGHAHRQLGDHEGAQLEFEAAQEVFEALGARPAAERAARLTDQPRLPATGLTGREIEVLRLLATGVTNRAIAAQLRISEKTVARHVSNIFDKLNLSSRTAATAYAYDHKLV